MQYREVVSCRERLGTIVPVSMLQNPQIFFLLSLSDGKSAPPSVQKDLFVVASSQTRTPALANNPIHLQFFILMSIPFMKRKKNPPRVEIWVKDHLTWMWPNLFLNPLLLSLPSMIFMITNCFLSINCVAYMTSTFGNMHAKYTNFPSI